MQVRFNSEHMTGCGKFLFYFSLSYAVFFFTFLSSFFYAMCKAQKVYFKNAS